MISAKRDGSKRQQFIIAHVSGAPTPTYTCGICGFVMNEVGECPRCKLQAIEFEREVQQAARTPGVFEQVSNDHSETNCVAPQWQN